MPHLPHFLQTIEVKKETVARRHKEIDPTALMKRPEMGETNKQKGMLPYN